MSLQKHQVAAIAAGLEKPFLMQRIVLIDETAAFLYLCSGFVARHRHLTQDELFYVYRGLLNFDTDWGRLALNGEELTVIPRGLSHLSGAVVPSVVMRFASQTDVDRKNGHGRVMAPGEGALPKRSLAREAGVLHVYQPLPVAQVDEMSLRFVRCQGATAWHRHAAHDEFVWVRQGAVSIGSEAGSVELGTDELMVIPRHTIHRIEAAESSLLVSLIHADVSPAAHMGLDGQTELD